MEPSQTELVDQNYVICTGLLTANTIVGEFFDSYKLSVFNTGVPNSLFNIVFVKQPTSKPAKLLAKGEQFFRQRHLPYRVSFRPGLEEAYLPLLEEGGYIENPPETVMTLNDLPSENRYANDVVFKRVNNQESLGHFQEIIEKSYSLAQGAGPYVITENILKLPDAELLVGYVDGCHACTSMLIKTGPVAGIYWVGTLAQFRNRGLGKAIATQAVVAGREKGCDFASLQATAMGKPVYKRIGFTNPYNYRNFNSPSTVEKR